MRRTERGFKIYAEFKDLYGDNVDITQSSLVTPRAVWIHPEIKQHHVTKEYLAGAHLNVAMAKRVIKALQNFVDGKE